MSEQATWVPIPRARVKPSRPSDAIARMDRLINWCKKFKPESTHVTLFPCDFAAFKNSVGTGGITQTAQGIMYRDFYIRETP